MARSARRSSSASESWPPVAKASPILVVTRIWRADSWKGCRHIRMTCSRMSAAASSAAMFSSSKTNSSPPSRATVSVPRSTPRKRAAISFSKASPAPCPRESLIFLNPSTSISATASRRPAGCSPARYCSIRLRMRSRLPIPVNGSISDCSVSCCSFCIHAVTSVPNSSSDACPASSVSRRICISR
ncbi:hypothetical protein D3C81_1430310 [compost metagenome]